MRRICKTWNFQISLLWKVHDDVPNSNNPYKQKFSWKKRYHWNSAIMPKHYKIKHATGNCVERNDQPLSDALWRRTSVLVPSTKAITTFYFSYWCSNSYKSISTSGANKNCNLLQQKLTQVNCLERENYTPSSLGVIMVRVISALEENNSTTILGRITYFESSISRFRNKQT